MIDFDVFAGVVANAAAIPAWITISVPEALDLLRLARLGAEAEKLRGSLSLIAAERKRQVKEEGWTPEHDAEHAAGELAIAAACYALPQEERDYSDTWEMPELWPWEPEWWKPTDDRVRELVKAGALIAAEIDRLLAPARQPQAPRAAPSTADTAPRAEKEK